MFDFDDVGMIIRGKFMAKPGKQFTLRKEIFNRVKAAFKENGIDFARREVRVAIPGLDDAENLTEEQKAAVGAAAADAVQGAKPGASGIGSAADWTVTDTRILKPNRRNRPNRRFRFLRFTIGPALHLPLSPSGTLP